ncbi:MAG: ribonuclease BN (tRNA processing enzyme) [Chlamydiales bacterium]|jgi:ribonuclease BN (tRNA processing enzyme)
MTLCGEIRVRLLPSACGAGGADSTLQYANSFVINDTIAVDAGSLGFNGSPATQSVVRNILLTHGHADHIASLPMLLINDYDPQRESIQVWGTEDTLDVLKQHVFNDRVWPDLDRIGTPEAPFVRFRELVPGQPVEIEGLRFTPVPVDHTVPTIGFLLEAQGKSLVIGGDSAPTEELWLCAGRLAGLRGVFLETSFPDREHDLAVASKHLTPARFAGEVAKLPAGTPMYAVHFKPGHQAEICAELAQLGLADLCIVEPGREYTF